MHPLLRRILVNGTLVFALLTAFGWLLGSFAEQYFNQAGGGVTLDRGSEPAWAGPARFGVFGLVLMVIFELLIYAKSSLSKKKPPATGPV